MDLDGVLNESKPRDDAGRFATAAPAEPVQPVTPEPAVAEPAKTEASPEAKPEIPPEVKPEPRQELTQKERAYLTAAEQERKKRQELERELAQYKQQPPAKEDAKTFWDDPEGQLNSHKNEMQSLVTKTRLQMSEQFARSKYKDFDENVAVFGEVLRNTPGLHVEWLAAPDPAEFAYAVGRNYKQVKDAGSVENMRSQIEKEVRAKLEAELKEREAQLNKVEMSFQVRCPTLEASGSSRGPYGPDPNLWMTFYRSSTKAAAELNGRR